MPYVALAGLAGAWYALAGERTRVEMSEYAIGIDAAGWPARGLTLLHVSDLHTRWPDDLVQRRKATALCRLAQAARYDVLVVTGDLVHNEAGFPRAAELLAGLREQPCCRAAFSVPGNHDYCQYTQLGNEATDQDEPVLARWAGIARSLWRLAGRVVRNDTLRQPLALHDVEVMHAGLRACGIEPLVNRAARIDVGQGTLWFAGVDDLMEGAPDLTAALREVPEGAPLVLLAHNPDAWLDPRAGRAGLVLSGHTHGGQVRLPLLGAIHTQGTHLRRSKASGWFRRGATRLFVTRGIGESLPLRWGARPQLALIHLYPHSR